MKFWDDLEPLSHYAKVFLVAIVSIVTTALYPNDAKAVDIQVVTSKSGVTAWLVEDHRLPIIDIEFAINRGSHHEPADKKGLAELMTGMLGQQAGTYSEQAFARALETIGAEMSFNASGLNIFGTLRTLSQNQDTAIELFRLAINEAQFTSRAFNDVRESMINHYHRRLNDADERSLDLLRTHLFKSGPFSRSSSGDDKSLGRLTINDVQKFYQQAFTREDLIVSVVGDIDRQTLSDVLDKLFADLPASTPIADIKDPTLENLGTHHEANVDIPQTTIRFALPAPGIIDEDYFAARILNHILGGSNFNSRLFTEVRKKRGLAYSTGTSLSRFRNRGAFLGYAAVSHDKVSEAITLIRSEITRLANGELTETDIKQAKQYITGVYDLAFISNAAVVGQLTGQQQLGLPVDYSKTRNQNYERVSLEDVKAIAKRYLHTAPIFVTAGRM